MKTIKLSIASVLVLATSVLFFSCKKDKDEVKKPDCRIITATPTTGDAINVSYNMDNKVSTISTGNRVTTFAYSGNTIIGTTQVSGAFDSKRIITTNANGLAINIRTETNISGTDWSNQALEYSGTELVKATYTSSSGGAPSVSMFTWANNNMVSATTGSSVTTLDYYTDKLRQTGDYLVLAQLVEGYEIYRTKNLVKSLLSGSSITSFSYNFDGEGKITSVVVTGSSNTTYTYQHQCN